MRFWNVSSCRVGDPEAEPYGSLLVNGKRIDKRQMAALVGVTEKDCLEAMIELEGNGVFTATPMARSTLAA